MTWLAQLDELNSTTREALIAELIGDAHELVVRMDGLTVLLKKAEESAQATASALGEANSTYRAHVDDQLASLRVEFAAMMSKSAEHAVRSLVGQQTTVLQQAATAAVREALKTEATERRRTDTFKAAVVGASGGIAGSIVLVGLMLALHLIRT